MNTDAIESLSLEVVHIIEPLIAVTIALTLGLALKDFAVNLIAGLRFKWSEAWAEGQKVYIDDEEATKSRAWQSIKLCLLSATISSTPCWRPSSAFGLAAGR